MRDLDLKTGDAGLGENVGQSVEDVELLEDGASLDAAEEAFVASPDAVSPFFAFASDDGPGSEVAGSDFSFPA